MTNLSFSQALADMGNSGANSQSAPTRVTIHAEDGVVLYAYGALIYDPKHLPQVVTPMNLPQLVNLAAQPAFAFNGESLMTDYAYSNSKMSILNNVIYDTSLSDGTLPPSYQSFLVANRGILQMKIGHASRNGERTILLRVSADGGTVIVDIPMTEEGLFLQGSGPSVWDPSRTAIWTVSFLSLIPYEPYPN